MSSPAVRELTKAEVASHKTVSDCWLIVSNRVYDVTEFLNKHPAGAKIMLMHGGRDCTSAFLDVHSESYLTQFLPPQAFIGVIKDTNTLAPTKKFTGRYWAPDEILSVKRTIYTEKHEAFRTKFRAWLRKNVLPVYPKWEQAGVPDIEVMREAFREGFYLRMDIAQKWGGLGLEDWRYSAIVTEEQEYSDINAVFFNLGTDMVLSYFTKTALPEQQARWLPKIVKDASIIAIAMSEPECGSDLASLATRAVKNKDGTWTLNGRKTWISAGSIADIVVISAVTDPSKKANGISLFAVEKGTPGFEAAKRFAKLGKTAGDLALLTLENVVVPHENLIGREGEGFKVRRTGYTLRKILFVVYFLISASLLFSSASVHDE